jgi:ribose transport system substrate-binding protein
MKRKLVAILLAGAMVISSLALVGCGNGAQEPAPEPEPEVEAEVDTDDEPEAEPEAEPEVEAEEQVFRVGVSLPPILNDFHATMVAEIENAIANAPPNFEFEVVGGGTVADGAEQVNVLERFYEQDFDGVVISPWDGNLVGPIAERIYNSGTPVVVINRMIEPEVFTTFVAGDNPGGARLMAHYIGETLGEEGGNVFVLRMVAGTPIDADRQEALAVFEEYYPQITVIGEAEGSNNAETGYDAAMNAMQAHPHIDVIYGHDEFAARGALQAFEDAGRDEIVLATGFSGTRLFLQEVEEDPDTKLRVAAYLPIMGATAIQAMIDILNGIDVPRYVIDPPMVLGPHNVDEWRDKAF